MVSYRAGGKLNAVAHDVILKSLDAENCLFIGRIELEKSLGIDIRHRKRIMRKVDFLFVFVPFVHRKIDDPCKRKLIWVKHTQLWRHTDSRFSSEGGSRVFRTSSKKQGVARRQIGPCCHLLKRLNRKKF